MLVLSLHNYSYKQAKNIYNEIMPLDDAIMNMEKEIMISHLWIEEIIAGDSSNKVDQILLHFDNIEWYSNAILNGDSNEIIIYKKTNNIEIINLLDKLKDNVNEFKNIFLNRYENINASNAGSKLDVLQDESFDKILKILNNIEIILHNDITFSKNQFEDLHKMFTFIIIAMIIFSLGLFYLYAKNEEKLKQIQSKNNNIMNTNIIYSRTNTKGIITEASDAFCNISKYSREELIGKSHNIVRHEDCDSVIFADLWKTIKSGNSWSGEILNKAKDGSYYWVSANIELEYDDNSNHIGYFAIRQNITKAKDFEKQHLKLMQSEKMSALGNMIGNIAHQWRQPLNFISIKASGINISIVSGLDIDDKKLEKEMNEIINKTDYLSQTINTFSDFLKETKKIEICDIKERINMGVGIVKTVLDDLHINLIQDICDDDIKILMPKGELPEVIINIVNNAKDVLIQRNIQNPYVNLSLIKNNTHAIITIEDNAGGIEQDILAKIFDPYFTTKHESNGTGLGLHMSYKIVVESFKGSLIAHNSNNGAVFTIEIPIVE